MAHLNKLLGKKKQMLVEEKTKAFFDLLLKNERLCEKYGSLAVHIS